MGHNAELEPSGGSGELCRSILEALPEWFGIAEAVDDYVALAERSPTIVAALNGDDVGFLTLVQHNPFSAEVAAMGVLPTLHRRGIGRMMLAHAERGLASAGVEFLQVKTLSATQPDEGYERTRAFYLADGFRPLEELPAVWGPESPALMLVKTVGG